MPDHIHMLLSVPPKYSIAMTIGYLKGKSATRIHRELLHTKGILKLRFFDVCGLKGGGFLLSADLGKMVVRKRTIRQPLKKEPPVLIMQDALPLFKSFLKPVSLKQGWQPQVCENLR